MQIQREAVFADPSGRYLLGFWVSEVVASALGRFDAWAEQVREMDSGQVRQVPQHRGRA
jgi:hypothetical protein